MVIISCYYTNYLYLNIVSKVIFEWATMGETTIMSKLIFLVFILWLRVVKPWFLRMYIMGVRNRHDGTSSQKNMDLQVIPL